MTINCFNLVVDIICMYSVCMLGDSNTQIGKIDYSQPRLGFEGLPELERFDICLNPDSA